MAWRQAAGAKDATSLDGAKRTADRTRCQMELAKARVAAEEKAAVDDVTVL